MDRLTDARFAEYDHEECPEYLNYGRYDVNIGYDDHRGNISSIDRNGLISGATNFGAIDQITLVNEKNRIKFATENSLQNKGFKGSSGQMGYDNNGNLTNDPSRGITTTYNRLNLPEQITVNNSSFTGTLTFTYDYDGNLLKRVVSQSSPSALSVTTEYAGGMEYVNGTLQSIYHEEGRYVKNGSNWHHEYVIRDHLGNNRVFFSDTNGNGFISMSEVSQEAHYYPFGMAMDGSWLSSSLPKNKYRYNGIEQTSNLGLDVYNAFYRTLDPSLGRWWQVDPAAEKFYGLSPYNSMGNNPIAFADPEGDFITWSIHDGGFSIGVNFSPIGIPIGGGLNFGFGDGFSAGIYGEVGFRVGGTGLGLGATVTQNLDHNFKHGITTTTSSAGIYGAFGPVNAGGNLSSTYNLTSGNYMGFSWGVSAGLGLGNEKGGAGLFIGYGSGGFNYGLGGYYDPRVELIDANVVLTANSDGSYSERLAQEDFLAGRSAEKGDFATNLSGNPNVSEVPNGDGTFTYTLNVPKRHKITGAASSDNSVLLSSSMSKGQFKFTTFGRAQNMTFLSSRPYSGNYFNITNFNVVTTRQRQRLWYINLFRN
ncbi:RHS repeat protein [Phaeodactylibacter xiamenensis]|uniref:RHS repeat protein n=1 Tax=Phaeodactylibacter xiamenensis TaxID=1524460 RepID=UPI0024A94411|nr:RHS repeat-associated core domain-containing protein [Phaeodactylibacter xiamenensis]